MKTKILFLQLFLCIALTPIILRSQKNEKNFQISYRYSFRTDTNEYKKEAASYIRESFNLTSSGNKSYFYPSNRIYNDSISKVKDNEFGTNNITKDNAQEYVNFVSSHSLKTKKVISDIILEKEKEEKSNTFYYFGAIGKNVKCTETTELIYTFLNEVDTFAGYHCNLATTEYAGRKYKIWYAPSIPIFEGPFVFQGLPGLILKVVDDQSIYFYIFENIQFSKNPYALPSMELFANSQKIEKLDFIKMLTNCKLSPEANEYDISPESTLKLKNAYKGRTDLIMMKL